MVIDERFVLESFDQIGRVLELLHERVRLLSARFEALKIVSEARGLPTEEFSRALEAELAKHTEIDAQIAMLLKAPSGRVQ